jgi:hypothetical protein
MFTKFIENGKTTDLYYHQTDGGAEYLTDTFILCDNGHKEGVFEGANLVIRVDGGELEIIRNDTRKKDKEKRFCGRPKWRP